MGATVNLEFLKLFENDWFLLSDFTDFFVGAMIAEGNSRSVFEFRLNPKLVIKIDRSSHFDNIAEWDIWHGMKDKHHEAARFLAPCVNISSCGRVMLQERTKPINREQLPDKIPSFLEDYKIQNWGLIGKRPVCHDYANHKLFANANTDLVNVEWWSDCFQKL